MSHRLTISIIIPAHNEADYIADCLNAIRQQTIQPTEIIVINNNSTDKTVTIAKSYKEVRVIQEPRQGQSFARNAGFAAASGDIIVRIDADTILPITYLQTLRDLVHEHPDIAGFTGYGMSRYEFIPQLSLIWSWGYFLYTKAYFGYPMLWGANMAVRAEHWRKLEPLLINDDIAIHEDQDASLALASVGGKVLITRRLTVSVQMESMLHYVRYRKYVLMMYMLKLLDREHPRFCSKQRITRLPIWRRALYWASTVLAVYGFYLVTFIYAVYRRLLR